MRSRKSYAASVAVVTGAASGIGLALSRELVHRGASVALLDNDVERLDRSVRALDARSGAVLGLHCDVTDRKALAEAMAKTRQALGPIHYFLNNAGVGGTLAFARATDEHWRRILDVNLLGVIHGTTTAFEIMASQGFGHIVNVSSIAGLLPIPGQALYNTTKFAVVGLSLSLYHELAAYGIHLTLVCPGPVVTPIWGKPIIGPAVPTDTWRVPTGAVEPGAAAAKILDGVAANRRLIVFPARDRRAFRLYRFAPFLLEPTFRAMARKQGGEMPPAS